MSESIFRGVGNKSVPLHHAYAVEGARDVAEAQILNFLEEVMKFSTAGNPDFHSIKIDVLGVEEARRITEMQSRRALSEDAPRKVFVIAFSSSTTEAQNALLKVVEEPSAQTNFFFIVPTLGILIPTLRSRLCVVRSEAPAEATSTKADNFLKLDKSGRLLFVKEFLAEAEKAGSDRESLIEFLGELESSVWQKAERGNLKDWRKALQAIGECRSHASIRTPSAKMILEHLSLVLPTSSR